MSGQFEFEAIMEECRAEQELKDAIASKELECQKLFKNFLTIAFIMTLLAAMAFLKQRNRISTEKKRSDGLLLNILPEEIAQELKENGRAEAQHFDSASILFTDFKGFTSASAKMTAGELVEKINVHFEAFDRIMDKYEIEKIKTIGDAYMAAGGIPVSSKDSVKNTILAALDMQDFIHQQRKENQTDLEREFEMRVGIHTGLVVAGIVEVKKFQYYVWSDTVNTASRMESNGEIGKVNISKSTYDLVKDEAEFNFDFRGMISVKGKGELEMYFVGRSSNG